jgi:hypothetical protein
VKNAQAHPGGDAQAAVDSIDAAVQTITSTVNWLTSVHVDGTNASAAASTTQSMQLAATQVLAAAESSAKSSGANASADASGAFETLMHVATLLDDLGAVAGRCYMDVETAAGWQATALASAGTAATRPPPAPTSCSALGVAALDPLSALLESSNSDERAELAANPGQPYDEYGQFAIDDVTSVQQTIATLRASLLASGLTAADPPTAVAMQHALDDVVTGTAAASLQTTYTAIVLTVPGPARNAFEADRTAGSYALQLAAEAGRCATAQFPSAPGAAPNGALVLSCRDTPCTPQSTVTVAFREMPGNPGDQIAIGRQYAPPAAYLQLASTGGAPNGTVTFTGLPARTALVAWAFPNGVATPLGPASAPMVLSDSAPTADTCSAPTIAWGPDATKNVCAGGFQYVPTGAPCYALKESPTCGPPTQYAQVACYDKFNCREKSFGVERSLPDEVDTTSLHVFSLQDAYSYCNDWESSLVDWFGHSPAVDGGVVEKGYGGILYPMPGFVPDSPSNSQGPGTVSCKVTFQNVVLYKSFHDLVIESDYVLDDYDDNPCPLNTQAPPLSCPDPNHPIHWPTCRDASFGLDPNPAACGPLPTTTYTAAGMQEASFNALNPQPGWTCTSCENFAVTDSGKPKCLLDSLAAVESGQSPQTTYDAALKHEVLADMKLLSELEGDLLTPAQQDAVWQRDLSTNDQDACEAPVWTPTQPVAPACSATSGPVATIEAVALGLAACANFTSPHTTVPSAATFAPRCFALAKSLPANTAGCDYEEYRDEYRTVANTLIKAIVSSVDIDPSSDSTDKIQPVLALIEQWYEGQRTLYPAGTDRTRLWGDASGVMGALWQKALSAPFDTATTTAQTAGAQVDADKVSNKFTTDSSEVVRKLFVAAFPETGDPPLHSAPLLYLLGDGMQMVAGRLDYLGLFHDLGCRFKGCLGGNVHTEVSEMWSLMASLAEPTALATAVTHATSVRPPWSKVFDRIQKVHDRTIQPATVDAYGVTSYAPSLLAGGDATTLPTPALGAARLVQKATSRRDNYANSGLLSSNATNTLSIGLLNSVLGTTPGGQCPLLSDIDRLTSTLTTRVHDYQAAQQAQVTATLGQLQAAQKATQLASQNKSTQDQFDHYEAEQKAFQASDAYEEAAFGDFMSAYNGVTNSDSVDPTLMIQRHFVTTNVIPGDKAARASSGQPWSDITAVAVMPSSGAAGAPPFKLNAPQGAILNLTTTGKWSPTCALRSASFPADQSVDRTQIESAQTGPEGYVFTTSGSSLQASSNTTVDSNGRQSSVEASAKLCAGVKGETGPDFLGQKMKAYFDASVCVGASTGASKSHTSSLSSSNGTEGRVTASFASGIHLPNTPFPEAPAGALLLVEMESGQTSPDHIIDVTVVQSPAMSVLVDPAGGADFYLVDNDVAGCGYSSPGGLNVQIAELQPSGAAFAQIGTAMTKALSDIKARSAQLIAQGKVVPDDMALLRAQATSEIGDTTKIPTALVSLFNTYVEEQLVHMERQIEVNEDEYQKGLLSISLKQIQDDQDANQDQARMYQLLTSYALANLNSDWLTNAVNPLLELVTNEMYPAAALRYPEAVDDIQTNLAGELNGLTTQLDWTNVSVDLANQAVHLVTDMETYFDRAVHNVAPQTQTTQLVLAFVNPSYVKACFPGTPCTPYASNWPSVDTTTAQSVWNAATAGTVASITLTPEMLYRNDTQGLLGCGRFSPVIEDIAVFIGAPGGTVTELGNLTANGGAPARMRVHDAQSFPTPTGLELYHFSNPAWLDTSQGAYVIGGDPLFALNTFTTKALALYPANFTGAAGLSPFGTFDIDMAGVQQELAKIGQVNKSVSEIDLILQVESNGAPADLTWISTCKP